MEIEDLLLKHAAVSEAMVIGVADDKWGERPLAVVVLNKDQTEVGVQEDIKKYLRSFADRGIISPYAVPDRVEFVDVLPRTSVGKLNKKALREKYNQ